MTQLRYENIRRNKQLWYGEVKLLAKGLYHLLHGTDFFFAIFFSDRLAQKELSRKEDMSNILLGLILS